MSKKTIIRTFQFRSSKNPDLTYSAILYQDGTASCNCAGWTRHVAADGSRSCKHLIAAGLKPTATIQMGKKLVPLPVKPSPAKHGAPAPVSKTVNRKFGFDED